MTTNFTLMDLRIKPREYLHGHDLIFLSIVSDDSRCDILHNNLSAIYPNADVAIRIDDGKHDHATQLRALFDDTVKDHPSRFYFTVDHDEVPILPLTSHWLDSLHPYKIPVYLQPQAKDKEEMLKLMYLPEYWNHFEFYKTIETASTYRTRPCHNAQSSFLNVPILADSFIKHFRFEYCESFNNKRCFRGHEYRLRPGKMTSYLLYSERRKPLKLLRHE